MFILYLHTIKPSSKSSLTYASHNSRPVLFFQYRRLVPKCLVYFPTTQLQATSQLYQFYCLSTIALAIATLPSCMFIVCLNSGKVVKLSWSLSFSTPCFYTKRRNALALPEVMMTNGWLAHRVYCTTLHTLELACMTQQTDYEISDKIISTIFSRPLHTTWFKLSCYFNCRLCF